MEIRRIDSSNDCGGFRPPKGHLDTQMYPECEGYETDRDIVKKTVEKRKKNKKKKKKSSSDKIAKLNYPIVTHDENGLWDKFKKNEIGSEEFIDGMVKLKNISGFPGLTDNPIVRESVILAIEDFENSGDYETAVASLTSALSADDSFVGPNPKIASINVKAKHGDKIVGRQGLWSQFIENRISNKDFVDELLNHYEYYSDSISKDPIVRSGIDKALRDFRNNKDYSEDAYGETAIKISSFFTAGKNVEESYFQNANRNDEMRILSKKKKKEKKEWDPNPWAVCTKSVGREDSEKFERCVQKVKEKQAFNLMSWMKEAKEDDWPDKLKKGRFTEYCKRQGFEGPCKECAEKALDSDDSSVRGMASFYLNTVKP